MNIAIDLTQIPIAKTGIGIYAVNLVREMIRLTNESPGNRFNFLFFAQDDDDQWYRLIDKDSKNNTGKHQLIRIKRKFFRKLLL